MRQPGKWSGCRGWFNLFYVHRECDLITAGELFGRSGYGVGLQKHSPWADKITLAILDYHESEYSVSSSEISL